MCKWCQDGHLEDNKISVVLEKNNKEILIHNVTCFSCSHCHRTLLTDNIINQLKNAPGNRIKILSPENSQVVAA